MDHKRTIGVIKEARTEIKKIESLRPSTPFNRSLKTKNLHSSSYVSRPSSCASIKSLKYEQENNYIASTSRRSSIEKFDKDAVDNSEVKLEPIVTKPILCRRKSFCSSMKQKQNSEFLSFPPLPNEKSDNKILKNIPIEEHLHLLELTEENVTSIKSNFDTLKHYFDNQPINESLSSESVNCSIHFHDEKNEDENDVEKLSEELYIFLSLLEKSIKQGRKRQTEETLHIIQDIYELLKEKNAFLTMFNHRTQLLKLLFKLLDSNTPKLSLSIIKILLQMKIKENNLTNILKLILKILRERSVDKYEDEFMCILFENMLEVSVSSNEGATMYSLKIVKQLCCDNLSINLMEKNISVLNHNLKEFNNLCFTQNVCNQNHTQMIIQILSTFHDLFDDKNIRKLLMDNNLTFQVLNTLNNFYKQGNIVHTAVRLISKLIDEEGCETIARCSDDLVLNLLRILEFYKFFIDITLQITFIIGRFVSLSEKQAFVFLLSPDFMKRMLNVFDTYVHEHIQFKENVSECFRDINSSGDSNFCDGIYEVIVKILSIWASICLSPEAGAYLATQTSLTTYLLSILNKENKETSCREHEDTYHAKNHIYGFLVVLGNISYYICSGSNTCIAIVAGVMPFLDDYFSIEIQLESANIIHNLTRHQEVREYIQENSLFAELIKLLTAGDKSLNMAAYGIIMNMLIDQSTHETFYIEQGIIRVLHKLHLCAERDWKTSAMMCQILWNFCKGKNPNNYPFSKVEVQHLIKFLSHYTYEKKRVVEKDQKSYDEWKNDFCPVADQLLEHLEKIDIDSASP